MWGEFVRFVEGRASGLSLQAAPGESEVGHMQGVMQVSLQYLPLRRDESEATQEPVMGSLVPPIREEQAEHRQQHSGLGPNQLQGQVRPVKRTTYKCSICCI